MELENPCIIQSQIHYIIFRGDIVAVIVVVIVVYPQELFIASYIQTNKSVCILLVYDKRCAWFHFDQFSEK